MEYYAAILNRTFLITIDDKWLTAVKCRGLTSVASGVGLARALTATLALEGNLNDPNSYVDERVLSKSGSVNFAVLLTDIRAIEYDPNKKWGVSYYPHDGRIYITIGNRRREFIVLGQQSGRDLCARLSASVGRANTLLKADASGAA